MANINKGYPQITRENFSTACLAGGLIAGFIGASVILIISSSSDIGYDNIETVHFRERIRIIICLLQMLLGGFLGWICSKFAWPGKTLQESSIKRNINATLIFIISFISIIFFRQLMTKDALVKPGEYNQIALNLDFLKEPCVAENYGSFFRPVIDTSTGRIKYYVRKGGGFFGEPDFETIATGLMGGIAFLTMVLQLFTLLNSGKGKERNSPGMREILLIAARAAFMGFIGWLTVYLVFLVLTRATCLIKTHDFFYASWVFKFEFPRPGRYLINFMLCAVYLFCFLFSIRAYSTPPLRFFRKKQHDLKTIKIFLASSNELQEDRKALRQFMSVENDRLHKNGIYLKLVQWEYFPDAIPDDSTQAEYIKALKECDIFLSLFYTRVGMYTMDEFEKAFGLFKNTGKPYIYTYFKKIKNPNRFNEDDLKSIREFEEKLLALGHFKTVYTDINDLQNQFKRQLESLLPTLKTL